MRYPILLFFYLLQFSSCGERFTEPPKHLLNKEWKFIPDDSIAYAGTLYDDSHWRPIEVSKTWQQQGYNYVGFAWYRVHFSLPKEINNQKDDSLKIFLGKIGDSHQAFLNGKILGENGYVVSSNHATDSSFTDKSYLLESKYVLPASDQRLHWDKENVLAVRVFNKRYNGGFSGSPSIGVLNLGDYIKYRVGFYKSDSTGVIDTSLQVTNSFFKPIQGTFLIQGTFAITGKHFLEKELPLKLRVGESTAIPVSLPLTTNRLKILLTFKDIAAKQVYKDSLFVPYVLSK